MTPAVFSPSMLNDIQQLKSLFTGSTEIKALEQLPSSVYTHQKGQLYMSRWRIAWVLTTAPFRILLYFFFTAMEYLLNVSGLQSLARRAHAFAKYHDHCVGILDELLSFGHRLLVPMQNHYQTDLTDLFRIKPIHRKSIGDYLIRKKLHYNYPHFDFITKGLCHGSVFWFNYLYLKGSYSPRILKKYKNIIEYAKAIATFFEEGQPRQAALLQMLYGAERKILDMKTSSVLKLSFNALKSLSWVKKLPDGIYYVGLPTHAISYIKQDDEQLIMDPSKGLILIERPEDLLEIIDLYAQQDKDEPTWFVLNNLEELPTSYS